MTTRLQYHAVRYCAHLNRFLVLACSKVCSGCIESHLRCGEVHATEEVSCLCILSSFELVRSLAPKLSVLPNMPAHILRLHQRRPLSLHFLQVPQYHCFHSRQFNAQKTSASETRNFKQPLLIEAIAQRVRFTALHRRIWIVQFASTAPALWHSTPLAPNVPGILGTNLLSVSLSVRYNPFVPRHYSTPAPRGYSPLCSQNQ